VVAESSSGKNYAVNMARDFHPPDAVHAFSAASPMALVYSAEDFEHKVVFYEEADSIPDEGPAGSLIRSLAEDNRVVYWVTEETKDEGTEGRKRRVTRKVEKQGPTGLITTSTKSLPHQLNTRMLEDHIPDDPQQTRAVMRVQARGVNPQDNERSIDLSPFIEFQELIGIACHSVVVPFADVLADLVPITAVRMRRDFKKLLTAVQAIALLYQFQRTPGNVIIATLDDYAKVRWLFGPLFEAVAADGLTPVIRETVEALPGPASKSISEADLQKRLSAKGQNLTKGTISWRVKKAIEAGWIINDEWRKGQPAKLRRGAPLPDSETGLPSVEDVRARFEPIAAV
jgi:hypothetical protein